MSHVTILNIEVKKLKALKKACTRLGLIWKEDVKTYRWFGRFMGDYPLPKGFKVSDLGHCTHAIQVPEADYEIGVVVRENGEIQLLWDFWHAGGLEAELGQGGWKLEQAYIIEESKMEAEINGHSYQEQTNENGDVELYIDMV